MNGKKKTIILIGIFVVLMVGASVLYNSLSAEYKMDSLVVENNNSPSRESIKGNNNSQDSEGNSANTATSNSSGTAANESNNSTEDSSKRNESQLSTAPDFTVYDLEGNEVNLTDFFGKPIIVNFWASWCGPCQMEMPDFDKAYASYKDEIEFLMVNMTDGSRETLEKASSFIAESGYTFPVYYDTDYSAAITYSVSSLPTTYFIDAEGKLTAHAKGAIDADTLQQGIDMIYNTEP